MLEKILLFLKTSNRFSGRGNLVECRELLTILNQEADDLSSIPPTVSDFNVFIKKVHDLLVTADTTIKSALLRVIRLAMNTAQHCECIVQEELHWAIITSLERDIDQTVLERMQALKLIKRVNVISPSDFPRPFARAIVAVGNHKDDSLRRVCLETLRELCIVNPEVVADVNGFSCLLEAVLDPSTHDMGESIVMSLLYLMSNQKNRQYVRPYLDLRTLLSPFSDLDTDIADLMLRWKSAKSSFVIIMRTWVGMTILTSDPLGLTSLVGMLKDQKVSPALQDVILDTFVELFEPVISKNQKRKVNNSFFEGLDNGWLPGIDTVSDDLRTSTNNFPYSERDGNSKIPNDNRKSYMNAFLKAASPFSPAAFKRKDSGATASKDRAVSDALGSTVNSLSLEKKGIVDFDPIYNLLDSYAAVLCSSFIHCGVVESLLLLGTNNEAELGRKARSLLLDILRVVCRIFPETYCSDLLTMPLLLEYATSSLKLAGGAHRASQILLSLADAFSITPGTLNVASENDQMSGNSNPTTATQKYGLPADKTNSNSFNASMQNGKFSPPCTVKNLRHLAIEIKTASNSTNEIQYGSTSLSNYNLLQDLNTKVLAVGDKQDFKRQIESSKVIGKEGKEPFKWDWNIIVDMLKGSFNSPDRLTDVLETKWVRRISGFYRCSSEDKAYFANMDYEPANLFYLSCACDLYSFLLNDPKGVLFIENDRRPTNTLFQDIAKEIEQSILLNGKGWSSNPTVRLVFRFTSCNQSMSREYFTLIGRLLTSDQGRTMIENGSNLFDQLNALGSLNPLDYLSRSVITTLSFNDRGYLSRNLIQNWTSNKKSNNCSKELHRYIHTILLALLRSRPYDFLNWGVDTIVFQLSVDNTSTYLMDVLEEAIQDPKILRYVIAKKPNLNSLEAAKIQIRLTGTEDGIDYLQSKNMLPNLLTSWKNKNYASFIESSLAKSLSRSYLKHKILNVESIPVVMAEKIGSRNSEFSQMSNFEGCGGASALGGEDVDIEGLMRVPWNIELKLTSAQAPQSNSQSTSEYLRVDTFLDASELPFPVTSEVSCDSLRIVKVRGIIVDGKGNPTGHPIGASKIINSCLLVGTCSVHRSGKVLPTGLDSGRRKMYPAQSSGNQIMDDLPVTLNCEHLHDWSYCKAHHRQGNGVNLPDGKFAITVPEHPVTWIFSRTANASTKVGHEQNQDINSISEVFLVEIHYHIKLETGLPFFVPIPRHLYGEMCKTPMGLKLLIGENVINKLIGQAKNDTTEESVRRSAFWGLGHIASTDFGCAAVCDIDGDFIEWWVNFVYTSTNFVLRGTAFYTLGLASRSKRGSNILSQLNWIASASGSHSAVAIPQNTSWLFQCHNLELSSSDSPSSSDGHHHKALPIGLLKQFADSSHEAEVVDLIVKMPGVILYSDSKQKLDSIRNLKPSLFDNRHLYIVVRQLLDHYTFKLNIRRDIVKMFSPEAKMRGLN